MNTPLLIYLIGGIFGSIIVGCWAYKQCHGDIVVSDLLWFLMMAAFGFGELRRQIEYKAAMNGVRLEVADRFYASSKTCHVCGHKRDDLTLRDRTYVCPHCGAVVDRDLNAARNLLSLINSKVGTDYPELTPADLTALHSRFTLNRIATSKVETGRQRKL